LHRILIVEDDATIARLVAGELEKWGFEVLQARNFAAVLEEFCAFEPHLVLMDLSLPHRSGFYWCEEIRRRSTAPIVFLSSAADNMNMVTALHQGADDFIAKPFDMAVLVAKVQATLRRSYAYAEDAPAPAARGAVLNAGEMTLAANGQTLPLTRNEMRILQMLMESAGKVVSREAIMRKLWDDESFIDENTLTVNVGRLRKKLEGIGLADFITTKKGEGYLISLV
jgi:DNA-binding response OmpR family regulator